MSAESKRNAQVAARQPASKKQRPAEKKEVKSDCASLEDDDATTLVPTDCSNFRDYGKEDQRSEWESVVQKYAGSPAILFAVTLTLCYCRYT